MDKFTKFFIVRHGETEWNVKGLIQGHCDSPLTEKGLADAKNSTKEFQDIKFDLAFSSDLLRAKKTADIIALEHNLTVNTNRLLRERNFGHLEGKSKEIFKEWEKALSKFTEKERFTFKSTDEIESDEEISRRLITFIREISIAYPNKKVLAVSHGGIIRALLISLGYTDYKTIKSLKNGAYIELDSNGSDIVIRNVKGIIKYS